MADEPTRKDAPPGDADEAADGEKKPGKGLRWPRWVINSIVLLLGLVIVVAWAPFLVPSGIVTARTRAFLTNQLGLPVALDRARLRGWFVLDIENLRIGETPMIDLASGRVVVSPLSLLSDTVDVRSVTLTDVTLHARTLDDGRLNFERLWNRDRHSESAGGAGGAPFMLRTIHARRARLLLDDVTGGRPISLTCDIDARWNEALGCHTVDALGEWALGPRRLMLQNRMRVGVVAGEGVGGGVTVVSITRGELLVGPSAIQDQLELNGIDVVFTHDRFGMRTEARFGMGEDAVRVSVGRNAHGDSHTNHYMVTGDRIEATGLSRTIAAFANLPAAPAEADRADRVPLAFLRELDARAELTFNGITVEGHTFENVHWEMKARGGTLEVDGGEMDYNDGTVAAKMTVDANKPLPRWTVDLTGAGIEPRRNMDPIINALMAVVVLKDPVNLKGRFTGIGIGLDAIYRTLKGHVEMTAGKGYAKIKRPPVYISAIFPSLDTEELQFDKGAGTWDFKGSVVEVDLRFATGIAKAVDAFAKGQVDLKARKQSLLFGVDMEASLGVVSPLERDKTDITLASLEGTFDEPINLKWYELQARTVLDVIKGIIIDDPVVLLSPKMSMGDKAAHFRNRLQGLLGVGIKPVILATDGAKWLLDGVHGTMRGALMWIIGEDDDEDEGAK